MLAFPLILDFALLVLGPLLAQTLHLHLPYQHHIQLIAYSQNQLSVFKSPSEESTTSPPTNPFTHLAGIPTERNNTTIEGE
ncbi:hypothetical protein RhiirA1_483734 [Rhizophagus irregularis]|uniref:Uncharacterized protein n=1 Tax=Rhizophagus irregularis TaxID=588596 RepID=A0A2N0QK48_9GLOM|nr:hypothetical protein RhiirA1_483734 [Rhizophagus irregularis]